MKLNYKRTFFLGFAFLSICAFWQLYDSIVPLILKETFGVKETLTGFVMSIDNILALFLLPFFGALSDKVDTRLGKRTPFILVGTIAAVIFMMLLPIADKAQNYPLFLVALGVTLLAMATYRSPAVALMPDLTPKPLRSKANAVINLMGAVGAVYSLIAIRVLVKDTATPDYIYLFLSVAALMIIAIIILLTTIDEKKLSEEVQKLETDREDSLNAISDDKNKDIDTDEVSDNSVSGFSKDVFRSFILILTSVFLWFTAYNAVTTAFSRYAKEVWGLTGGGFASPLMVGTVAAVISYIPIGEIASKIGRKKAIIMGIIVMTASYFFGFLFKEFHPAINIVFAFTGFGWAAINVNSYPMVVEMSRSSDVGKYTGYYYTASMAAQIFTPIFSGFLIEKISYRILFPYAIVFSILSLLTMLQVRHGDSKPLKKANKLENFEDMD